MSRLCALVVIATALTIVSAAANAAGSYHNRPPFDHLVIAGPLQPQVKLPSLPQINPSYMFGGCGRGLIRDPQSHSCHGPGDIGPR
jgi:hypothetical protein